MSDRKGGLPRVSVGIATWNSEEHLQSCAESLTRQTYAHVEIIVVDNASADKSVDLIRDRLTDSRIIRNDRNEGYCIAQNQAIRESRGDYYLPIHPDVRLMPAFIEEL